MSDLREALENAGCWMAEDWGDQHNSADCDACTIDAAARRFLALTETGQRIEWCETHGTQVPYTGEGVCWRVLDHAEKLDCRIVSKWLSDYTKEE